MTTTPSRTPTTAEDGTGRPAPGRLLAAIGATLGPLLFAAANLVTPYDTDDSTKDLVATIAGHQGATELSLWLWAVGTLVFAPGLVAVGLLATARSARLGLWGAVLFGTGLLAVTATPSLDTVVLGGLDEGVRQDALVRTVDGINGLAVVNGPILYFIGAHVVGAILLGVAFLRGRTIPAWAAWLLIVSMPLNVVGHVMGLMPLVVLSFVLPAVAFGCAGLVVVRHGTGWVRAK
ncbi:hypothetical protein [Streptomyces sp. YU58]|uniref:hypothetical protein n=1 Tax=Streptomyces sp. SX92 TaxID=3158972 RepID=UPI0027BADE45|nr:hypothetical protein [Streptomyces coralus]WLW52638.1 hypothetical protein QU709_15140 [Streptomyces coralus]